MHYSQQKEEKQNLREKYLAGGMGYGQAKEALFELILKRYAKARETYNYYMQNINELEAILHTGAQKASEIANQTLLRVRTKLGY